MKILDPHLHLFDLSLGDYHWLKRENPPFWSDKSIINRSFSEQTLQLNSSLELAGFVHIEAGFNNVKPWQEVTYLEQSCQKQFRSIAAINLLAPSAEFTATLNKLVSYHSVVGVRHILDEQALYILNNKQALLNFTTLDKYGLIFETQLPLGDENNVSAIALIQIIETNRNTHFIINHAGFPPTESSSKAWLHWQANLAKLAKFTNVAIKCSGWEMSSRTYSEQWLSECLQSCVDIFGIERVMLASNFPLCLFSQKSYHHYWFSIINNGFIEQCNEQQKNALLFSNALRWYRFNRTTFT